MYALLAASKATQLTPVTLRGDVNVTDCDLTVSLSKPCMDSLWCMICAGCRCADDLLA
jgi:hypothetical protein